MDQSLLSVDDVAERLGVPIRFVRRLVDERRIPFYKIGRYVRFEPDDVEQFIADGRIDLVAR